MGIKHLAQISGMGECSTIISYYYFVKETVIEELPSLTHLYPLLPQYRASLGYITLLRFPSLWIARKQAQEERAAKLPVAPSQKYGSRMTLLHCDSTGNFVDKKTSGRARVSDSLSVGISKYNREFDFSSCLSYMSLSMPTLSSRMKFTFKRGFCHSHMESFQSSSHVLFWNCWREEYTHLHIRDEFLKSRLERPQTVMNNVQDRCRKYINYESLHLKDVIARE